MKYLNFLLALLVFNLSCSSQQQTFDLISYKAPAGWSKKVNASTIQYTKEDKAKNTYAVITLYKALPAGADSKQNFDLAWKSLVAEQMGITEAPTMQEVAKKDDWEAQSGLATFTASGVSGAALLVATTGYGKLINILVLTNTDAYQDEINAFMESLDLDKAKTNTGNTKPETTPVTAPVAVATGEFKFNTTNFDDGWVATEQPDWVDVSKGNLKVLIHYPKDGTIKPADPEPFMNNAWNILVAPRYHNMKNYKVAKTISEYDPGYLAEAFVTDNKTNKEVYVVLFRKGDSGFLEFICPDKPTFVNSFGVDPSLITWTTDSKIWGPFLKMVGYNRFAVAQSDFKGKWTNNFSGMQQWYNVYTGNSAGMTFNSSNQEFDFTGGNHYNWKILAVNGMVGNYSVGQAKSSGTFSVPNNWQVNFSDIEGKPKTYNAYFSCIKGARLLWLQDAKYPTTFTTFGKSK